MIAFGRARGQRGFTLLELLIAVTLLGVLAGLLYGGLRFGVRVWERGGEEADRIEELLQAQSTVIRLLASALAVPVADDNPRRFFAASADAVRFLAPAPAAALAPGVYRIDLFADPGPAGTDLVLEWRLAAADEATRMNPEGAGRAVLVAAARDVRFFFLRPGSGEGWVEQWDDDGRLPALVQLAITFAPDDRRTWPALIAAPLNEETRP